ncbi:MAG: ribosome-associated translation inhibitor RaiA [bacterium]
MSLIIKTKHCALIPSLQEYIEKKTEKFHSFIEEKEIQKIEVIIEQKDYKDKATAYKAQVTLWLLGNTILRAEEKQSTTNAAIDLAAKKIENQIGRYKGRFQNRIRHDRAEKIKAESKIALSDNSNEVDLDQSLFESILVKRTKQFPVEAMSIEEAVERMELLDHNFFVFLNNSNQKLSITYKRTNTDDEYGIIEPQW